jgi:hypothetical protein
MNPFRFGEVVTAEYQCPRPALLKTMLSFLRNGRKVLLQGERRAGKTSFICHVVARAIKQRLFLVSLWGIKTPEDLARQVHAALVRLRENSPVLRKARRFLKTRFAVNLHLGVLAAHTLPASGGGPGVDVLEQLLDELYAEHKATPVLAVWDEFQEVENIPDGNAVIGRLRNAIQHHSGMAHVFAGSERNQMHRIFNDPNSPFFKGAVTVAFGKIEAVDLAVWIRQRFKPFSVTVTDETMEAIFGITDRVSGDVQQLCSALWTVSKRGDILGRGHLGRALREIWAYESRSYEAIVEDATDPQLRCLKALARHPGIPPHGVAFGKVSGVLGTSSASRALKGLAAKSIITKTGAAYKFINPFFAEWLKTID